MAWGEGLSGSRVTRVETKSSTLDVNSPRLLEAMRGGLYGVEGASAMRISAVYSCVKVLAESIATMPVNLYSVSKTGTNERLYNKQDRLVSIAPSEGQTAAEMWSYVATCLALHGNAYLYMTRTAGGRVVELLPVSPSCVSINIDGNQISYTVTIGEAANQRVLRLTNNELLHFKGLTLDGYTGISPISYNHALIAGEKASVDYGNRIISEGATPHGVLETEGVLSDEAFENLRDSWKGAHGGDNNGNRVALLESGVTYKPISLSPVQIGLLDGRKYSRTEIAGIYRVPPHMIGEMSQATYSNIADQSKSFYRYTLAPWLTAIEQRLNHSLAGPGQLYRFDVDGLLRPSLQDEATSYKSLIETGILSPNEVRERMGLGPREGGDAYITETNNLSFNGEAEAPAEEAPQPTPEDDKNEESPTA